jgi:PAS domain S-box-containing protein
MDARRAEEGLDRPSARFQKQLGALDAVIAATSELVYLCDRSGTFLYVSPSVVRAWGLGHAALIGKNCRDLGLPASVRNALDAQRARVFETGRTSAIEFDLATAEGRRSWECLLSPIDVEDEGIEAAVAIVRDVTRRREMEEALRDQAEVFRLILDGMGDGVIVADLQEQFLVFNPAAESMFGLGATNTRSEDWPARYGLYLPDMVTPFPAERLPLARAVRGESVNDVEMFVRHSGAPDGRWALISGRPLLDAHGEPRGGMIVCRDVTERKIAEDQLRLQNVLLREIAQSERLAHEAMKHAESQLVQAEKLTALGQMVAGVAHEINNPLAFVGNNLAVCRRDLAGVLEHLRLFEEAEATLAEHRPELLARLRDHAETMDLGYTLGNLDELLVRSSEGLARIRRIVKDLRDFARLDEADRKEVDLNEAIHATANIVRVRATDRGIALDLELEPLPPVECYPGKINQVVMNLLLNAIDACKAGGRVTVRTRPATDGVEIDVVDTGHGIDPSIRDRIFDPFFTTKPIGQGTGLGLSTSYGIVKAHGGRIDVESSPGQGSRFTVRLPLSPSPAFASR